MSLIDITFDVYSDTPEGKDPDSYSATLRQYHQILWSKPLPCEKSFSLDLKTAKLLHHKSELGEFFLSSDAISNEYVGVKKMSHIVEAIPSEDIKTFFRKCSTIGSYIIFPSKRIDNKMTINGSRGTNQKIMDRFDLTLECIRRFYTKQSSPLTDTLERYADFFNLFEDFKGYIDFFLLQDLVENDYQEINFYLSFDDFNRSPLPNSTNEYYTYKENTLAFVKARNERIYLATQG